MLSLVSNYLEKNTLTIFHKHLLIILLTNFFILQTHLHEFKGDEVKGLLGRVVNMAVRHQLHNSTWDYQLLDIY